MTTEPQPQEYLGMEENVTITRAQARKIFNVIDGCIEIVTANIVHGEVSTESWETLLGQLTEVLRENKTLW